MSSSNWKPALVVASLALLLGALIWWGVSQGGKGGAPKRQTAKVSLLPDAPPPPPPKEEPKKEPPKEEPKEAVQINRPQATPDVAPPSQQLKMEGAAGDGPGLGQAGVPTREGIPGTGAAGGASAPLAPVNRQAHRMFANSLRSRLQAELEKELGSSDIPRVRMSLSVWTAPSGAVQRYELSGLTRPEFERDVRAALDRATASLRLSAPSDMPQPISLDMSVLPQGG